MGFSALRTCLFVYFYLTTVLSSDTQAFQSSFWTIDSVFFDFSFRNKAATANQVEQKRPIEAIKLYTTDILMMYQHSKHRCLDPLAAFRHRNNTANASPALKERQTKQRPWCLASPRPFISTRYYVYLNTRRPQRGRDGQEVKEGKAQERRAKVQERAGKRERRRRQRGQSMQQSAKQTGESPLLSLTAAPCDRGTK